MGDCPVLYSFRRCPYAMRARMGLYRSGAKVELREIVLRDKPAHMLAASPKGTVPVLVLHDGTVIDESLGIMQWALGQNDPDGWMETDMATVEFLINRNDGPFKNALDRYKYPARYPDEDCSGARNQCETVFADLDQKLQKHAQLVENKITVADIALFPFLRQCAHVDRDWFHGLPFTRLQEWLTEHLESNLFKAVMPKFNVWKEGQEPVYFGP